MVAAYDLTGRVALVTGAGRGIGKGIAEVLAEAGADVVVNALTLEHAEPLAARLRAATGRRVVSLAADVTRPAEVERAVAWILEEFGATTDTGVAWRRRDARCPWAARVACGKWGCWRSTWRPEPRTTGRDRPWSSTAAGRSNARRGAPREGGIACASTMWTWNA